MTEPLFLGDSMCTAQDSSSFLNCGNHEPRWRFDVYRNAASVARGIFAWHGLALFPRIATQSLHLLEGLTACTRGFMALGGFEFN